VVTESSLIIHFSFPFFVVSSQKVNPFPIAMAELDDCCKTGFQWDGKTVGYEGTLDENQAYITGSNKEAAVLLVHDLFGWKLNNLRLLADHFAKEANCTCYVVDLYDNL
jgi:hypothetical protein